LRRMEKGEGEEKLRTRKGGEQSIGMSTSDQSKGRRDS